MPSGTYRSITLSLLIGGIFFLLLSIAIAIMYYAALPHPIVSNLPPVAPEKVNAISDIEHLRRLCQITVNAYNDITNRATVALETIVEATLSMSLFAAIAMLSLGWRLHRLLKADAAL